MAARDAAETLYGASREPASSWSCMAGLYIDLIFDNEIKKPLPEQRLETRNSSFNGNYLRSECFLPLVLPLRHIRIYTKASLALNTFPTALRNK